MRLWATMPKVFFLFKLLKDPDFHNFSHIIVLVIHLTKSLCKYIWCSESIQVWLLCGSLTDGSFELDFESDDFDIRFPEAHAVDRTSVYHRTRLLETAEYIRSLRVSTDCWNVHVFYNTQGFKFIICCVVMTLQSRNCYFRSSSKMGNCFAFFLLIFHSPTSKQNGCISLWTIVVQAFLFPALLSSTSFAWSFWANFQFWRILSRKVVPLHSLKQKFKT